MVSALWLLSARGCLSRMRLCFSMAMCSAASAAASRASSRAFAACASSTRFRRINISVLSSTMECAYLHIVHQRFGHIVRRLDHLLVAPALNQHPVQDPFGPSGTHGPTSQPVRPQLGPPGGKSFRRDLLTDQGGVKCTWRPGTPPVLQPLPPHDQGAGVGLGARLPLPFNRVGCGHPSLPMDCSAAGPSELIQTTVSLT
jgi:hypothetical protein